MKARLIQRFPRSDAAVVHNHPRKRELKLKQNNTGSHLVGVQIVAELHHGTESKKKEN